MTRLNALMIASLAAFSAVAPTCATRNAGNAKVVFCAYGAESNFQPADHFKQFVVAVVEINSRLAMGNVPVSPFKLTDGGSNPTAVEVLMPIEEFDDPFLDPAEDKIGYYTWKRQHVWDGKLAQGRVRLRVRGRFIGQYGGRTCRVNVGPFTVERPVDAVFASG
ncbi:MAG: hypothetical protein JO165_02455 [Candidatus Eremiobacteraeota bacterium]|nr:hypothetical protein [Candidatus Eremiobacteraeota bacterium]